MDENQETGTGKTSERGTAAKRWLLYVGITFLLTYAYEFGVIYPLNNGADMRTGSQVLTQLLVAACMFFPAIGVLLTRLLTKEGFGNAMLMPHFKGNIRIYLLAYFGPAVLTLLGCGVYFLAFPGQLDLSGSYLAGIYAASGVDMGTLPIPFWLLMLVQVIQAMLLGPLLNIITCFGEEWGWRGYMVPKMAEHMKPVPMLLLSGVIWGLWHAPLTALGHNYGVGYAGYPFTGILAMCGFCIVMDIFFSFLTLKTKSCLPAILAHGGINSIAAVGIYLTTDGGNPFIGPAPTGIIGASAFIVVDILLVVFWFCRKPEKVEV